MLNFILFHDYQGPNHWHNYPFTEH